MCVCVCVFKNVKVTKRKSGDLDNVKSEDRRSNGEGTGG